MHPIFIPFFLLQLQEMKYGAYIALFHSTFLTTAMAVVDQVAGVIAS